MLVKPVKIGQLVRWHNTTVNRWKCGLVVDIVSLVKDSKGLHEAYPKQVRVLWDTGELKIHGTWKLFPFDCITK